jgi:hypothetical protein
VREELVALAQRRFLSHGDAGRLERDVVRALTADMLRER